MIFVSETWMSEGNESYCNPNGFNLTVCHRPTEKGGGVAIYSEINHLYNILTIASTQFCNLIQMTVIKDSITFNCVLCYNRDVVHI